MGRIGHRAPGLPRSGETSGLRAGDRDKTVTLSRRGLRRPGPGSGRCGTCRAGGRLPAVTSAAERAARAPSRAPLVGTWTPSRRPLWVLVSPELAPDPGGGHPGRRAPSPEFWGDVIPFRAAAAVRARSPQSAGGREWPRERAAGTLGRAPPAPSPPHPDPSPSLVSRKPTPRPVWRGLGTPPAPPRRLRRTAPCDPSRSFSSQKNGVWGGGGSGVRDAEESDPDPGLLLSGGDRPWQ